MTQALKLLHTYYTSGLSLNEPTSFSTHRKQLLTSAKVCLMQANFPLTCALALSYSLQCWDSCNVMTLFQGRLHAQTESWGRQLLPTASILKLQRTPCAMEAASPVHPPSCHFTFNRELFNSSPLSATAVWGKAVSTDASASSDTGTQHIIGIQVITSLQD